MDFLDRDFVLDDRFITSAEQDRSLDRYAGATGDEVRDKERPVFSSSGRSPTGLRLHLAGTGSGLSTHSSAEASADSCTSGS